MNSNFLVQSTETHVFDIFSRVFVTHTREYEILTSLLTCTQVGIFNTLQAPSTCYKFTHEFFAFIILPGVNILQAWLLLSRNYYF